MKKFLSFILYSLFLISFSPVVAQTPSWTKKAVKSVFTLKTFAADGSLIGNSNGFFVGTDGEAISSFTPFRGAKSAVVIDAQGKEMPVLYMLGANDTYDVAKFRVDAKKTVPLTLATTRAAEGEDVWMLPYLDVKNCAAGTIRKAETFNDNYAYYTIALTMPEHTDGCPLLNTQGEAIGLMQQPAVTGDSLSYAVSALFADSLKITGLSINDQTLRSTDIKKDLPNDLEQAILTLFVASSTMDSLNFAQLTEDFISRFPDAPDGYVYRAQEATAGRHFDTAAQNMEQAIKVAEKKDEVHFAYSKLIYQKQVYMADTPYEPWSLEKALAEAQEADRLNPMPVYRHQQAVVLYAMKRYDDAANIYKSLFNTELRSPELFYEAARCYEVQRDTTTQLALLDSCVATFSRPYLKEAAPYLLARAQVRMDAGQYRNAVADLNDYEQLMQATVNDRFYYLRHRAEVGGRLFQQALDDIDKAISMVPEYDLYYAEKASLQVRVGLLDEAIETAKECIRIAPEYSDGYLFLGVALCQKGEKEEGIKNLRKAKELGDPQADALIERFSK